MSLTVKAYLLKEPETNEIRRFSVDPDVSTNHAYLRQKITQIFPTLTKKSFSLYWKDAEDELIAFSSDDEQTEALGFVNDGIFKIYIKVEDDETPDPEEDTVPHPHVVCDGCEGPVIGIRYKCTVCPDFDLCSTCKAKGLHSEHNMMSISPPKFGGWMGFGCFPPPPPPFRGHHFGGHPCGGPPFRHPPFAGPGQGRGCPFGRRGRGGFGWRGGRGCRPGRGMFHGLNAFWAGASHTADDNKEADAKAGSEPSKEETKTQGNKEQSFQGGEEYLKTIGQHVAAMLDPLGINVEVDVEHGGRRQQCGGQAEFCPCGPFAWASWGSDVHSSTNNTSSAENNTKEKMSDEAEESRGTDAEMETGNVENTTQTGDMESEQDTETGEKGATVSTNSGEASPEREWTIIDDGNNLDEKTQNANMETETKESSMDPPTNTEDHIAKALDHMKAMGFTDEGGWLTTLLQATSGDINKALDAIRANRGK